MDYTKETVPSTKNTKNNRKVLYAKFDPFRATFKIPDGIDLYDKTVVAEFEVSYETLYICYADGRKEEIDAAILQDPEEWVDEVRIDDAWEWNIEYSEDEEDEDEKTDSFLPKNSHQPNMDYTKETVPSLKQMCKERRIRRYSKKTKNQLIKALRENDEGIIKAY